MKIYCNRYPKYTLDDFIGKPYWVLCYISRSPYMTNYIVKPIANIDGKYKCRIIHNNFIGVNDRPSVYIEDTLSEQDIRIVEPLELYNDDEQSNYVSWQEYAELYLNEDDNDDYEDAGVYPI